MDIWELKILKLYNFQKTGVDFLAQHKYALLADEMGLGKSVQAIKAAEKTGCKHILVICPASVKYVWKKEIEKWSKEKAFVVESSKDNICIAKWIVVNYDLLYRKRTFLQLIAKKFHLLICDEAHYLKNAQAKRTKTIYHPKGLKDRADRVWLLTGTPVLNRPVELFTHLSSVIPQKLGKYSTYVKYCERYCNAYYRVVVPEKIVNGVVVRPEKKIWDMSGASNIEELSNILDGFMLRRLKKDVLPELPEKTYQNIYVEIDNKTLKKEGEYHDTGQLGEYATQRRKNGLVKIPFIVNHIKDVLENTSKTVVFAYHREVISELMDGLQEFNPVKITGQTKSADRQKAVKTFVAEKDCRVFIGQIEAAGTGIDGLQNVCSNIVFAEMSWVPGEIDQAIDRCHRIGQENPVLIQFIIVEGSIDEDVALSVARKTKVIKKLVKKTINSAEQSLQKIRKILEGLC